MELVSIIIPVYNVEKYLNNCVVALCNQTYKNVEIILVDDGSTDKSGLIADEFAKRDKRVKVIHKKNSGSGYARNTGLDNANGSFVTFVDSDDSVESNLIELLMNGIKKGSDVCVGGFKRVDENSNILSVEKYRNQIFNGKDVYSGLFSRMLGSSPCAHDAIKSSVWNSIYSMDIIRKNGLRFPSQDEYFSEDLYFNFEYFSFSEKATLIDSTAYCYRVTPGSLTQKYKPQMLENVIEFYTKMENKINDKSMIMRLQRQLFVNIRCCMVQERVDISGKTPAEIKNSIKNIINHPVVCRVATSYLDKIKQFKQKIFVYLIKHKCIELLYMVIRFELV